MITRVYNSGPVYYNLLNTHTHTEVGVVKGQTERSQTRMRSKGGRGGKEGRKERG